MTRRFAAAAACALAMGVSPAPAAGQSNALTLGEVLDLRRRGVSTRQILRNAQEYCVAFTVTDSVVRELKASGADSALIGGIRQACLQASPHVQFAPGVLLDDNFSSSASTVGRLSVSDRLCTAQPNEKGMRIENRRRDSGCAIDYPFDLADGEVRIELTIAELGGETPSAAVVGFGKKAPSADQYSFSMTADNRFELCLGSGGQCRRLLSEQRVTAIRPGPAENRLGVEIRSREIILYINDERVGRYLSGQPASGTLSLGVGPHTTAVFSRLQVRRIQKVASAQ